MTQWLRLARATLGGIGINYHGGDQLKIEFSISKDIGSSANDATITFYNLRESTRNGVGKELEDVTLEAGYENEGNVAIIFSGQIRDVEHRRNGPDILTAITCGDGDKALRKATTSRSYPKGTKLTTIIDDLQADLEKQGVAKGEWRFPDGFEEKTLKRPFAMCGGCVREMDMLGRSNGFYWSVQNGATEIIPSDDALDQVVFLSKDTGLVGVPTITDNGVKFEALLNPEIRPGRKVQIESEMLEMNGAGGLYRVSSVTYAGSNRDGDMLVSGHGEAYSGAKVDEGIKP